MKGETGLRKSHLPGVAKGEAVPFDWIETWYNLKRRHTFNNYCSPTEYEASWAV
jgi:transposase InsO family protein